LKRESEILLLLRYLNALDRKRGVEVQELAKFLGRSLQDVDLTVLALSDEGKVYLQGGRIWLTPLGFSVSLRDYS
jgi:hypothetical protein